MKGKIILAGLLLCLFESRGQAPSGNQNYIIETAVRAAGHKTVGSLSGLPVDSANRTIRYLDGLGRPFQTVQWQGSPNKKDLVQVMEYDALGLESKKYLPYAEQSAGDGAYKASGISAQGSYYGTGGWDVNAVKTDYPYSRTIFEPSPLNRVVEQGAPGADWQPVNGSNSGHTSKMSYSSNTTSEVLLWQVSSAGASAGSYYDPGKLFKAVSMDENWTSGNAGTTEEFKDFDGRVVLRRIWKSGSEALNTYYIYDDLGNLRYAVPPAVTVNSFIESDQVFDQFIYGYHYDGRRRLVEKKIPGKGWEFMVYNKFDQVTHTQDANQRGNNQWSWTKYDALGRIILTGVENGQGINRVGMQSYNDGVGAQWEDRTSATSEGYSHNTHPEVGEENGNVEFLSMNYYDDYNFPGYSGAYAPSVTVSTRTRGLATGSFVRILGTATKLLTVTYYDEDGRVIETISDNRLGGKDRMVNSYNFAGELTSSIRKHEVAGILTTIVSGYSYDHVGRKHTVNNQIYNGSSIGQNVQLSEYVYNEIGQLSQKKLHNGMQVTAMVYNERGWLKSSISNEFSIQLGYQENGANQYNGNISKQFWSQNASPATSPNVFSYNYDALNRLTNGTSTSIYMSEVLNYDNMGNINQLSRNGGAMNQYYYNGNRLDRIDNVAGTYAYDANGNATTDGRNGMTLTYNLLNLPSGASGNGKVIQYVYDASGDKLRKVATENSLTTTREYIDGIEYDGNNIDIIHTEEGVAQRNGDNSYSYHYNLSDHLGNVRYTFDVYNGLIRPLQVDNYYPFGKRNSVSAGNNKYLYNGKEVQDELGMQIDYGARFYDPEIGRWNAIDPKAELGRRWSPYTYAFNDPIRFIDPDGMWPGLGAWGNAIKEGFLNHYAGIKQVLTTNPVTTVKRMAANIAKHPGESLANASTGGMYGKVKESYMLTKSVITNDAKTGGNIIGNTAANVTDLAIGTAVGGIVSKGVSALRMNALTKQVGATASELNSAGDYRSTVVGAELNGKTVIGTSGPPPAVIAPQLEVAARELGGVGAKAATGETVGCCGEFHSANDLLLKNPNATPSDINFTPAIRPRTGLAVPTCSNCATMFKKKN